VNYIEDYHSGAWFATDIPVNYDPRINYDENLMLRFKMMNNSKSKVDLNSEFEFKTETKTKSVTTNSYESDPESKVYNFVDKTHKVLHATSSEKIDDYYDKVNTALDPNKFKGHKRLQDATESVKKALNGKDLKNPLRAIGAISTVLGGPIGAGLGILSSFIGKSNSMATGPVELMPMISVGRGNGFGTITGKIEFNTNATAFPLQLPGANHTYKKDSTINVDGLPIYDKPLGVISLDSTPYLQHKMIQDLYKSYGGCHIWEYDYDGYKYCYSGSTSFHYRVYNRYTIADDLNLVLNEYSDAEIITIKTRFLAKEAGNYEKDNYIGIKIENGEYDLIENGKDYFVYGTPFTDLSNIKNRSIDLYSSSYESIVRTRHGQQQDTEKPRFSNVKDIPVYIQFLIALKPKDPKADQTPIIHNITYHLDKRKIK